MTQAEWSTKHISVASLHLDAKNPRLGAAANGASPRELIHLLFEHDKAMEVAQSIALRGFFPNEPLLVIRENEQYVVVEGNRRLAALKALRDPGLLDGTAERQVERFARRIRNIDSIAKVPVILAPSRRATDRQVAGKHVGTPVLAWQAENRASFILEKLTEGYDTQELLDELGFSAADVQAARQTKAIADMARSLTLAEEVKSKLENPRTKLFTTIERVFDSTVGRSFMKVAPDPEHGLRGLTTKTEFLRGFSKLITDVALGRQSSRTLNTNDDIQKYFDSWQPADLPASKRGSFLPSDLITGSEILRKPARAESVAATVKQPTIQLTVLPNTLKIRFGSDRLIDIRRELTKLKRADFPNAGAVLLRVFFELAVTHYLERTGELTRITTALKEKGKLNFDTPTMKQLIPEVNRIAREKLPKADAAKVEKAIKYDSAAPFTLSDLHAFVHQNTDLPGERDILQFWLRTEPLFRLMLEQDQSLAK